MPGSKRAARRAALVLSALFAVAGSAQVASADPDVPQGCLVLALATKRFEDLNDKVKGLDGQAGSAEQVRANVRGQVALWRQMRDLFGEAARNIADAPELAEATKENGEAIGQYADAVEELLPHSKENPPSAELKARFESAGQRKGDAGAAMTDAARRVCAQQ
ncbi:MAG: hypothetical protein ACRC20_04305 [Segniliparus sp.]|uniref:hypothetical protein n=1 Tax=Segniliparus sp. TaxID=2804064 RepID=UPI003F315493